MNELNVRQIGKHPSQSFNYSIHLAVVKLRNYHLEREDKRLAVEQTRAAWIWERLTNYIVFNPSDLENGENYGGLPTETNRENTQQFRQNKTQRFLSEDQTKLDLKRFPISMNEQ